MTLGAHFWASNTPVRQKGGLSFTLRFFLYKTITSLSVFPDNFECEVLLNIAGKKIEQNSLKSAAKTFLNCHTGNISNPEIFQVIHQEFNSVITLRDEILWMHQCLI